MRQHPFISLGTFWWNVWRQVDISQCESNPVTVVTTPTQVVIQVVTPPRTPSCADKAPVMKQLLSIQSAVAAGFVGNSVAGPVLTALGQHPMLVDTIMLAAHPGYGRRAGGAVPAPILADVLDGLASLTDLSAIGTVLADDPEFTCRTPGLEGDSPHRFILDANLRTPPDARLLASAPEVGLTIFCREDSDPQAAVALREAGAEVQSVATDSAGRLALGDVMQAVAETGCGNLMVEGGGKLGASLLRDGHQG